MAATVERIAVTSDIDVFTIPHSKLRKLIVDTTEEVFIVFSIMTSQTALCVYN